MQSSLERAGKYWSGILSLTAIVILLSVYHTAKGGHVVKIPGFYAAPDTIAPDTSQVNLPYQFNEEDVDQYKNNNPNPLFLKDPSNIESQVEYDPETGQYTYKRKIGDFNYRPPQSMSLDEYRKFDLDRSIQDYWRERALSSGLDGREGIIPEIHIGGEAFDRIFGGNTIDIRPQGSAELIFGVLANRRDDPQLNVRQQRTVNFDFQEKIQMNVIAKIGDKIEFRTNYNTESTFEFENKLSLKYEGEEDDIIKLIEAGDVSFALPTTLIQGSQSLFGIKTKLQFGRTTVSAVFSQQESETSSVTVQGGAQTEDFELKAIDYEENRHFFLGQYYREDMFDEFGNPTNRYDYALSELPIIRSNVNITKIEVWVTNIGAPVEDNRNIIAFTDLGESNPYSPHVNPYGSNMPNNYTNDLLVRMDTTQLRDINNVSNYLIGDPLGVGQSGYFISGVDFEKVESARKLNNSEFNYNSKLGFISLNTNINSDQTLAVAYQYTIIGDTTVYQVGEFSDQGINAPNTLTVKLLKSTSLNTNVPLWDLMMKNVYSLGAYQVNSEDFILNILYSGNDNGVPTAYLTEGGEDISGVPLLHLMNFDNLDRQQNPIEGGDGLFDFINGAATGGGTIQASNGRVFFTVLEPFGSYLNQLLSHDTALASRYVFDSLYASTKVRAEQFPDKNKFLIAGSYKSSTSNEIALNALNVPQGSVKVTAGGITLTENVDYTVDYTLGRVRIINEGILNSGTPINVSMESTSLFSIQTKRYMGLHVDHALNDVTNIGATIINLTERPITQKTNYGDDPISNTIYGLNFNFEQESRFLTKMVDKLPFLETKAVSKIAVDGEFAHFLPGHSRAIGKAGTSYIDDFEGSKSTIDLRNISTWFLASTPQGQTEAKMFPEGAPFEGLNYGKNRARAAWYIIDPLFYDRNTSFRPPNVDNEELSKHSVRQVDESELFPGRDNPNGIPTNIAVFNFAYYPEERGPYNYDVEPTNVSDGIDEDGSLSNPDSRWAGIMRKIESTDFEATNVEYIEFWMMDPFADDTAKDNTGELFFNLGDISEDILRDGRKGFENGLPTSADVINVDTTIWGRVPTIQALVESFDNEPASREFQDVGYDGLQDEDERTFMNNAQLNDYLIRARNYLGEGSTAYQEIFSDPSSDNYHHFRGSDYDNDNRYSSVLERYKLYNGPDGNSPTDQQNPEAYPTSQTTYPNVEDINRDNTLSEAERYFQYKIQLSPDKLKVGENYVADARRGYPNLLNGDSSSVMWYQFKIPVRQPDKVIGNIQDFKSIRFMRMFVKNFERQVVLRFATFELVRGEWRRYNQPILSPGEYIPNDDQSNTTFDISAVNIEENERRYPVPYRTPPGIEREINVGTTDLVQLNEQAMVMKVCELLDGDARAAYKTAEFDFRRYKHLKMFVHAEQAYQEDNYQYGDMTFFLRIGSDFTENYYEYEIPLEFTPWGTSADPELIWPEANRIDIDLEQLVDVKHRRNISMRDPNSGVTATFPYIEYLEHAKVTVVGVPSISDVKALMMGVRNPKQIDPMNDDGLPKCAEIWVNELRLTDFDNSGGWAGTARVSANLADFGRVVVSGAYSSAGFGSVEQKVNETQKEAIATIDVATDLELGKFFNEESGVHIPMHFDFSETRITPEYNPLNPDILLKKDLDSFVDEEAQDSVKKLTVDYTKRTNLNFINVRKDRKPGKKPKLYDVENFDVSYSYNNIYNRSIDVEYDESKQHRGGLGYNFTTQPKNVKPFESSGFLSKSPYFALIKDFNFYYLPRQFSFRTDMIRDRSETKMRNKSMGIEIPIKPYYNKNWDWNRSLDFKFDLAESLTLEYTSQANAFINEPQNNPKPGDPDYDEYKEAVWNEIGKFGTMKRYNQAAIINYNVPLSKIPILDWTTLRARYQGTYNWNASATSIQDRMGNAVENQAQVQVNGDLNFSNLYNKVPYFKRLLQSNKGRRGGPPGRPNRSRQQAQEEEDQAANDTIEKPKPKYFKIIGEELLKIVLGVKRGSITYTSNSGTMIPGFFPEPQFLGMNLNYVPNADRFNNQYFVDNAPSSIAPSFGFVFGDQRDIRSEAARLGWLSPDTLLNQAFATKRTENLTARLTIEPITDLRIELTADRTYSMNHSEYYRLYPSSVTNELYTVPFTPTDNGSYSISTITWATAFTKDGENNINQNFENFKDYRQEVAQRLAERNPHWNNGDNMQYFVIDTIFNPDGSIADSVLFPVGYGPDQQEVLYYSFLAAYTGKGAGAVSLDQFQTLPLPNWRVTYSGLSRIEFFKRFFKTVTLSHSYRSNFAIGSFASYIGFSGVDGEYSTTYFANTNNYIPKYDIGQITIMEQFAPLFGLDLTMNNSLSTKLEFKKSRNLTYSFINNQLTEVQSDEFVLGLGYRFKDVSFTIRSSGGGGRARRMKSDLDIRADVSVRTNKTILRRIDEDINQVSAGQKVIRINTSADYMINQRFNIRLFFDKDITNPFVSNQYRNSTTNGGVSLRFTLNQ